MLQDRKDEGDNTIKTKSTRQEIKIRVTKKI